MPTKGRKASPDRNEEDGVPAPPAGGTVKSRRPSDKPGPSKGRRNSSQNDDSKAENPNAPSSSSKRRSAQNSIDGQPLKHGRRSSQIRNTSDQQEDAVHEATDDQGKMQRRKSSFGSYKRRRSASSSSGISHISWRRTTWEMIGRRTTWKRVAKTALYIALIAFYISATTSLNKKFNNKNVLAFLRALPMFWLAALAMPALNTGILWSRYKRFITVAFIMAGVADALFQLRGVGFSGAMVTHAVAYIFVVAALAIKPLGTVHPLVTTLIVVSLVYLYVIADVHDNVVRLNLVFLAVSIFLMIWRAIVRFQLVDTRGNLVILIGCILLATADVILVFAIWKNPICSIEFVYFAYYAGMLALDLPLQY